MNANRSDRPRLRRLIATALVGTTLVPTAPLGGTGSAEAAVSTGAVSGTVWNDLSVDGEKDAGEPGVAGVMVKVYASNGTLLGTTTTDGGGVWSVSVTADVQVRVEFATPDGYESSVFGVDNGTSIQFSQVGAVDVDFGVHVPAAYCDNNPDTVLLATGCQRPGDNVGAATADRQTVNVMPFWRRNGWSPTPMVNAETGAVWGIAHQPNTGLVWASAVLRRHAGFGPEGPGGIYVMKPGTGQVASFDVITDLGISVVGNAGNFTDANRGITPDDRFSRDEPGWVGPGTRGIGDIDFSPDGKYLYMMNLNFNGYVNKFEVRGTATEPTLTNINEFFQVPTPTPACATATDLRPWAIEVTNTDLYVGAVCSNNAASVSAGAAGVASGDFTDFVETRPELGYILKMDLATEVWSTVTTIDFDYERGLESKCDAVADIPTKACESSRWHAWTNNFAHVDGAIRQGLVVSDGGKARFFPQPMITDLEILADGSFVVGVNDRFSMQTGFNNLDPDGFFDTTRGMSTYVSGDVLMICKAGTTTWAQESDGSCGDRTGTSGPASRLSGISPHREFFWDQICSELDGDNAHTEISQGGLAVWPRSGNQVIAMSAMDPWCNFFEGGVRFLNAADGTTNRRTYANKATTYGRAFYGSEGPNDSVNESFGKSGGMADLEIVCDMAPVQIGNRVWDDIDGDGIQDADEPGIAGVTVRLYDDAGNLIGTAITSATGDYYFTSTNTEPAAGEDAAPDQFGGGLIAGFTYTVKLDNPADYTGSGPLADYTLTPTDSTTGTSGDLEDSIDNDSSLVGGSTYGVNRFPSISVPAVGEGANDHTYDFGFTGPQDPVAVSNYTWWDQDGDGIQDDNEPPLAGVVVTLLRADGVPARDRNGNLVQTTTDANGLYFFDNLRPGTYTIDFDPPAGYGPTQRSAPGSTSANDSNPAVDGVTPPFRIASTVTGDTIADTSGSTAALFVNPTIDAGFVPLVAVGNYVWIDSDKDGIQGDAADEPPLPGVVVTLYLADGTPAIDIDGNPATATTDATGRYFIDKLVPGTYYATFTPPPGYLPTGQSSGGSTSANDSNPDITGRTPDFTLVPAVSGDMLADTNPATEALYVNPTIDAGFVRSLVGMGDYTWVDTDRDGVQDADEPPLEGVVVTLYNPDGTPALTFGGEPATATTDENGYYFIDDLLPGDYYAVFTPPTGYTPTQQSSATSMSADDSNPDEFGETPVFTLSLDENGDMELDEDPGTFADFIDPTIDAGFVPPKVGMGDYTWIDYDRDGVQDADEPPLAGVVVNLYYPDGTPALDASGNPATATTDANGYYFIDNLWPGEYKAEFVLPDGYEFTSDDGGASDEDSNPDPDTGFTPVFTLYPRVQGDMVLDTDSGTTARFVDPTIDAGVVSNVVGMGDYVWIDYDRDGVQDADEPPLEGVVVTLYNPDGTPALTFGGEPATATTDENGYYFIDDLLPGDYYAVFTAPAGYTATEQSSGTSTSADDSNPDEFGETPVFTLSLDENGDMELDEDGTTFAEYVDPTIDAGFVPPKVGMGDYTWIDYDRDGVQDADEPPLAGVVVNLYYPDGTPALDADGNPATATTDANGYYFIDNLWPGEYKAEFVLPDGYAFTKTGGGTSANDSNPAPDTGFTPVFTIGLTASGDTVVDSDGDTVAVLVNPTIDAGVVPLVAMGDYTWIDSDRDGVQDADEKPLAGVVVNLLNPDGTPALDADGNPATATTDANGYYFIDNLLPGTYKVEFVLPEGYAFTKTGGGTSATDSNPNPATGITPLFTLHPRVTGNMVADTDVQTVALFVDPTIDAGVVQLVAMGDYTWIDSDRDGVQDTNEKPLAGVVVNLLNPDGTPALDADGNPATATTDASGYYFIDNLLPGDYRAEFILPDGYVFTRTGGGDSANDSNPDPGTGVTPVFTLVPRVDGDMEADSDTATIALFVDPTIDAGVIPLVSITSLAWLDLDGDGVRDPGEPPLPGVRVELLNPDGTPALDPSGRPYPPVLTDADGRYRFDGLPPGDYRLRFTPPPGYGFTTGSSQLTASFTVEPGDSGEIVLPAIDAGFVTLVLPPTGSEIVTLLRQVLVLFVAGSVLLVVTRRRRLTT